MVKIMRKLLLIATILLFSLSLGFWLGKKRPDISEQQRKKLLEEPISYWKGKKIPTYARKKMSEVRLLNKNTPKKETHWNWKGGISEVNDKLNRGVEWKLWREKVYKRDNWTCQKCKKHTRDLRPHHILNFSTHIKLRFSVKNGITLCEKCHNEFHKIYGKIKNNRKQLTQFL